MQAQLHNATAYNADTEALKGQTLAVGSAKATVIQFATAGGYDGAVTVEISPDNGTTWFTLQAESLAALGTYVSSITSFTPAYRVIVPSQVQLRCRMSGGTAGTLTVTAVPSTFAARSAAPAGNPYALKVLGYSPTIFYRMNADTDTTVTDSSGNGLNGVYYGDLPTFGDGSFLDSSGTPAFTENTNTYADELITGGEFSWTGTWAQWVYIPSTSTTDYDQLMRFDHYTVDEGQSPDPNPCQLFLGKSSTTQLRLRINRGTQVDTFFSIALDEWMFIAVTMNNTEAKLYVNGDLLATITGYGTNNVALDFDWDWFLWGAVFTGNLANCAYWKDVILSASDIEDLADVPSVSEAFSPIFGAAPTLSTNTPVIGTAITITPGAWAGSPSLTYQWQRNTGSWVDIGGATSSSYTPVNADFGYPLRVVETGTNGAGSASTNSAATSIPVTESSLFGWWDSSDLSTLFQDSAATTPVASVSDPVGAWVEKTGKNRTFQQAGASTIKPAYQGANAGISFDGGDYLTLYSQSTNFTAQTVIAVVKLEAAGNVGARVFNQVSAGGNDYNVTGHYIPIRRASSFTSVGGYAAGGDRAQVTNANGVKSVIVARHSGSAIVNRVNGTNGSSYSHTLNYTPERMRLMSNLVSANDGPGETGAGTYYELFVFSTEISAGLLAAIETLVNTKWP